MRRLLFALMAVVTAWSFWAWAEPQGHRPLAADSHRAEALQARAEGHGEPPGERPEESGPAPMNWFEFGRETPPFLAMLINFGILAAGYYLFGKAPLAAALQNRRGAIAKEIEEAQAMKREAEARAKTYQGKLDRLDDEMRAAREALVRAGEAERDRIVAEAEANAERMRKDAHFLIEQEIKQIRQDLWHETLESAVTAAEEILKGRVTPADQERLAEEYLADLGGKPRPAAADALRTSPPGAENAS